MKQNFPIQSTFLGLTPYQEALSKMNQLRGERLSNKIPDQLLFLEHPPVITMGRRKSNDDFKRNPADFKKLGIEMVETDRGGKLTYHGPGQLVVYFIFNIEERRLKIGDLVWRGEEGILCFLKEKGIKASRDERNPGIWVGNDKIASLGFHVTKGVTTHGVALNVNNDLKPFSYFVPCGLAEAGVTSVNLLTGKEFALKEISFNLQSHYVRLF